MPAGLGKGIFLKKRSSQVFYPFKAYPLYTIPLPRSDKGARINVVLLNLVIDDPVAYLQIAGGLQHIAMRMLQGVMSSSCSKRATASLNGNAARLSPDVWRDWGK